MTVTWLVMKFKTSKRGYLRATFRDIYASVASVSRLTADKQTFEQSSIYGHSCWTSSVWQTDGQTGIKLVKCYVHAVHVYHCYEFYYKLLYIQYSIKYLLIKKQNNTKINKRMKWTFFNINFNQNLILSFLKLYYHFLEHSAFY